MTTVRAGKCRHRKTVRLRRFAGSWGQACECPVHADTMDALVCRDCQSCGAWLPLGPARDTPATAIELRAAELALLYVERKSDPPIQWCTFHEWLGLEDDRPSIDDDEYRAGALARCIAEGEK